MAQRQFRDDDTSTWVEKYGNGSDGALSISTDTTWADANEGCSGTSGTTAVTLAAAGDFADGDLVLIHQSRGTNSGKWELNAISSGATTTSLTMKYDLVNTYADSGADQAQMVELKQYSAVTVDNTKTLLAPDWDGSKGGILPILCNGSTEIIGTNSVLGNTGPVGANTSVNTVAGDAGIGFTGGTARENAIANQGEGTSGAGAQASAANGTGGGGGNENGGSSDGDGGTGGGGGYATGGGNGETYGAGAIAGTGGGTSGAAGLTTMDFGGSGGGGSQGPGTTYKLGAGGSGGGIIIIISKTITTDSGSMTAIGGNGGGTGGGFGGGHCSRHGLSFIIPNLLE